MEQRKTDRRMSGDRRVFSYAMHLPERRVNNNRREQNRRGG